MGGASGTDVARDYHRSEQNRSGANSREVRRNRTMAKKQKEIAQAETTIETCPACTAAVGSEATCTQCGADLEYYRKPPAVAAEPSEPTEEANTEKASE
jgi:hypothetical protein